MEHSPTLLKEDTHLEDSLGATPRFGGDEGNNSSQVGCIPLHLELFYDIDTSAVLFYDIDTSAIYLHRDLFADTFIGEKQAKRGARCK